MLDVARREDDVRKVCNIYMAELITSLIQMLVDEDRLIALDEYTFLLTALRQYSGPSKRIANMLVLQVSAQARMHLLDSARVRVLAVPGWIGVGG